MEEEANDTPADQLAGKIHDVTNTVDDPEVVFEALLMNIVVQMAARCPSCRQQMAHDLKHCIPAMLDKAAEAQRIALQFGTIKCVCEEEQYAQSPGRTN